MIDIYAETSGQIHSTLDEMIREAEREYEMRRRHYPRFVEQGKLPKAQADEQLRVQQDIVRLMRWIRST